MAFYSAALAILYSAAHAQADGVAVRQRSPGFERRELL